MLKKVLKRYFQGDIKALLLIILGTVSWSLTMVKSGLLHDYGIGFWGANGHDGIWHIALANSLAKGSWEIPIYAGELIKNYHIGFDLLLAILHKLTRIAPVTLYFQVIPPILALLTGLSCYRFVYSWKKSQLAAFWSTFFVYFGGGFGWLVSLVRSGTIDGESTFWSQQSVSSLINPPFALSILLIFIGLNLLLNGIRLNRKNNLFLSSIIFGLLIQVKVYAAILTLGGLLVSGLWNMFRRKGASLFKVFTGALIVSVLIFSPTSESVKQVLKFKLFWFLETMMVNVDRLNWQRFGEAMVNYKTGAIWFKAIPAFFIAFVIFWYGNFGTRFLFEIYTARKLLNLKKTHWIDVFFISIIFAGVLIPTFFIQSGNSWNTIQFMYYSLIFSGILAGVTLTEVIKNTKNSNPHSIYHILIYHTKKLLPFIVVLLTIPTTIGTLKHHYLPGRPPAKISKEELEALKYLEQQPDGIVLTLPFDKKLADAAVDNPPRPLYFYESTAYVSAFSGKKVYLEDEVNLEITGYDWKERRDKVENFIKTSDPTQAKAFLTENNISYVYWIKPILGSVSKDQEVVKEIFQNEEIQILKTY